MNPRRYLCSELVNLRTSTGESVANLEEIWEGGAVLECENALEADAAVQVRCGKTFFAGRVIRTEHHEFGCRAEVEFSPLTRWSPEQFQPQHMLDPSELTNGESI